MGMQSDAITVIEISDIFATYSNNGNIGKVTGIINMPYRDKK